MNAVTKIKTSEVEEIAEATSASKSDVDRTLSQIGKVSELGKTEQANAEHATDFTPPIYNIWKQQEKSNAVGHFGNSEVRWVDNLLYLYTKPFDVVLDPFAGGGSTIDICKKRFRRYFVSDRKPIVEREKEIRQHDLICGTQFLTSRSNVTRRWLIGQKTTSVAWCSLARLWSGGLCKAMVAERRDGNQCGAYLAMNCFRY